jgi:hypothetical protein
MRMQASRVVGRNGRAPSETRFPASAAGLGDGGFHALMTLGTGKARLIRQCRTSLSSNRRMRKTACPVVWKGYGAQSP